MEWNSNLNGAAPIFSLIYRNYRPPLCYPKYLRTYVRLLFDSFLVLLLLLTLSTTIYIFIFIALVVI